MYLCCDTCQISAIIIQTLLMDDKIPFDPPTTSLLNGVNFSIVLQVFDFTVGKLGVTDALTKFP